MIEGKPCTHRGHQRCGNVYAHHVHPQTHVRLFPGVSLPFAAVRREQAETLLPLLANVPATRAASARNVSRLFVLGPSSQPTFRICLAARRDRAD